MNTKALRRELSLIYEDLKNASAMADAQGNRASARQLKELMDDLRKVFESKLDWVDSYIGQPKFEKYFKKGEKQ